MLESLLVRRMTAAAAPLVLLCATLPPVHAQDAPAAAPPTVIAAAAPVIVVSVDGQAIVFTGQGPVMDPSGSSVMVPLRGVFEKLGAGVQYAAPTKTISAVKGGTSISLRLGDSTAYVNNTPRPLSVPPQLVNGATLVPLRFVSEALGAMVSWNPASQSVAITTPRPPDNTPVTGIVVALDPAERSVTVHPAGADKDIKVVLLPDAPLLTKAGDAPAVVAVDLPAAVRVGDLVTIKRNDQSAGFSLQADYEEKRGTLKTIDPAPATGGNVKFTFSDDSVAEIAPSAPLVRGTEVISLNDIQPGLKAVLRVNPQTRIATAVMIEIPKVEITAVTQSAGTRLLKTGDEVSVSVMGTPGAKGVYSVPGVSSLTEQPLIEAPDAPGTYSATFKVPEGALLTNGTVTALLSMAGVTSAPAQAPPGLAIDAAGPVFADLAPGQGSNSTGERPRISGTYSDQGSGVDPAATRLFVRGKDVTAQAKIEKGFFLYETATDLPAGDSTVTLVARDLAGNETRQEWTFTITPIVSPLKIVTLVEVPENRPLGAGETLKVRAEAQPGGSAKFTVGKNGAISSSMFEQAAGVYVGSYLVKKGDSLTKQPVTVFFTPTGGGSEVTLAAIQTVTLSAGAPRSPIIDLPAENSSVGSYTTVSGRGTPNTKVRLRLTYNGKIFLLNTRSGGGLAAVEIPVGADGAWKTELIPLNTSRDLNGITFTAEAVTVAGNGDTSDTAIVHFKR